MHDVAETHQEVELAGVTNCGALGERGECPAHQEVVVGLQHLEAQAMDHRALVCLCRHSIRQMERSLQALDLDPAITATCHSRI